MLLNYLTLMFRNLRKHKLFASINIIGLTAGITFALLIGGFTWSEMQVNQTLKSVDRLYLLELAQDNDGPDFFMPIPLMPKAIDQYPQLIEGYYRFWDRNITISRDDKHFRIQSMVGDSTLISTFGLEVISGNDKNPLSQPNSIVITQQVATQFFGNDNAIGETLLIASEGQGLKNYQVTAVIADQQKKNTVTDLMNMNAQVFLSRANGSDFSLAADDTNWQVSIITYVKLREGATADDVNEKLNAILKESAPVVYESGKIALKPLSDYYLITNHGSVQKLLSSLSWAVVLILILAIANFTNITVGGSLGRIKEVGVRKAIGGIRKQVIAQFMTESLTYSFLSTVLGLFLYELLHKEFGVMMETNVPSVRDFTSAYWLIIIGLSITVGTVAGIFPAFHLATTNVVDSLKGKFKTVSGTVSLSRILIGLQFVISLFILACAVVMTLQFNYFLSKDLGYDRSQVLLISSVPRMWNEEGLNKVLVGKEVLKHNSLVESASLSLGSPSIQFNMGSDNTYASGHAKEDGVNAYISFTDEDYAGVYGLTLIEGSYFNKSGGSHVPSSAVINESTQRALSVKVGDKIKLSQAGDQEFTVVGIVKDFNFESLHEPVKPVVLLHVRDAQVFRYFSLKLRPGNLTTAVQEIEKTWREAFPDDAFLAIFADERVEQQYKTELKLRRGAALASALMIVIVMTGVFGLVALTVARRTKEIGIRKVLGGSATHILTLIAKDYVVVLLLSCAVAMPLSIWFITRWLDAFSYHITLQAWMFAAPVVGVLLLTLLIVLMRTARAAMTNPVRAIRYE
ncbi:ABC transporter permease [Chryseolinea sp. T2]|uniref:ABC transporter permease n=1 Tax=Chryseolinea sp. T2 TaxID=3129255 RepID=UPI0030778655